MNKRIRQIFNIKGVTLIELIVAMIVMVTIMIAVTSIFAPMFRAYQRANNLAEVNSLIDNISALVMNDIASANEVFLIGNTPLSIPDPPADHTRLFSLRTTYYIDYTVDANGILCRAVQGEEIPVPLLPPHYYKFLGTAGNETVFTVFAVPPSTAVDGVAPTGIVYNAANGNVTLTLTVQSADGWFRTRTYTSVPIGLAPPAATPTPLPAPVPTTPDPEP